MRRFPFFLLFTCVCVLSTVSRADDESLTHPYQAAEPWSERKAAVYDRMRMSTADWAISTCSGWLRCQTGLVYPMTKLYGDVDNRLALYFAERCLTLDPTKRGIPMLVACAAHRVDQWIKRNYTFDSDSRAPNGQKACVLHARGVAEVIDSMEIPALDIGYREVPTHILSRLGYVVDGRRYEYVFDSGWDDQITLFFPDNQAAIDYASEHGVAMPNRYPQ